MDCSVINILAFGRWVTFVDYCTCDYTCHDFLISMFAKNCACSKSASLLIDIE